MRHVLTRRSESDLACFHARECARARTCTHTHTLAQVHPYNCMHRRALCCALAFARARARTFVYARVHLQDKSSHYARDVPQIYCEASDTTLGECAPAMDGPGGGRTEWQQRGGMHQAWRCPFP
eukprot:1049280-Pleurochrysis_carterae.AAC.1